MSNIYWDKERVAKEEIFSELMRKLPHITDSTFTVRIEGKDAVCVAEREEEKVIVNQELNNEWIRWGRMPCIRI